MSSEMSKQIHWKQLTFQRKIEPKLGSGLLSLILTFNSELKIKIMRRLVRKFGRVDGDRKRAHVSLDKTTQGDFGHIT